MGKGGIVHAREKALYQRDSYVYVVRMLATSAGEQSHQRPSSPRSGASASLDGRPATRVDAESLIKGGNPARSALRRRGLPHWRCCVMTSRETSAVGTTILAVLR